MADFVWSELRDLATETFGEPPGPMIENRVLAVFHAHPSAVDHAIRRIGSDYRKGKIHSPWPVLAKDVERIAAGDHITATDTRDRDRAVTRAEQWVRATGAHFDRPEEIEAELFVDAGAILQPWADDPELVARMIGLWHTERPRGKRVEREAEARGRAYAEARKRTRR